MGFIKLIGTLFIIVCIIITGMIVFNQMIIYNYEVEIGTILLHEIEQQEALQQELRHELNHLLSEEFIERIARNELGFIRAREMLFIPIN